MATKGSDWLTHFRLLLLNCCTECDKTLQEASTQGPLPSICVFRPDLSTNMVAKGSDWLTLYQLLLYNHCTEFHQTLQEARNLVEDEAQEHVSDEEASLENDLEADSLMRPTVALNDDLDLEDTTNIESEDENYTANAEAEDDVQDAVNTYTPEENEQFQGEFSCIGDLNVNIYEDDKGDSEDDFEEQHNKKDNDKPIHSGTDLSLGSSVLLILTFVLKYSLSGEAFCNLLSLINLHCPADGILPQTVRQFWQWFDDVKYPLKFHKYCSNCHLILNADVINRGTCPNELCRADISQDNAISNFIEIPIEKQIQGLFARETFFTDICHRFSKKKCETDIEDIYDGRIYKQLSTEGNILSDKRNLSLHWNTDGIPCFKSSNMSLWPLFFQINELPYAKRINPDNMILGGLWFGPKKPSIISYTEPFLKTLTNLETNGVHVCTPDGNNFISRVIVIGGTADLPARSLVCNTTQFNGKYGCNKCLQPGQTHKTSKRGHVHIFPFDGDCPDGPQRSHEQTLQDAISALDTSSVVHGVKGPTFLQSLRYYNLVAGICIDYMHGVLLGVTKLLLNLWFMSDKSKELFSFADSVDIVDNHLKNIKPPNSISRVPRSIKDHLKYWKGSELRSWLLYYSLPILKDILHEDYYQHYLLFVNAIYILLQDSITAADVEKSEALLKHFCCMFAALYGDRYMTCNIHQLLHLAENVRDMGPLWAYSCFSFENANGVLLRLYHGTQYVDLQIAQTVSIMQNLPIMQAKYIPNTNSGEPHIMLYNKMKEIPIKKEDKCLSDNVYVVGATDTKMKLTVAQFHVITTYLGHTPTYLTFNRVKIKSEVYHSRRYRRCSARNSFTIAYLSREQDIQYGLVECYLQMYPYCDKHAQDSKACGCMVENVALVSQLQKNTEHKLSKDQITNADIKHIVAVSTRQVEKYVIVPMINILHKCVMVEIRGRRQFYYVCKMPNTKEQL